MQINVVKSEFLVPNILISFWMWELIRLLRINQDLEREFKKGIAYYHAIPSEIYLIVLSSLNYSLSKSGLSVKIPRAPIFFILRASLASSTAVA